jgi:hypothetical protein
MARKRFAVQAPAVRADVLPRELQIDGARLELFGDGPSKRGGSQFRARWSVGRLRGDGRVEVRRASKGTSLLVVALEAPTWLGRLFGSQVLSKVTEQFGQAMRYEIETRTAEETDAFTARRTTAELVRQRSA